MQYTVYINQHRAQEWGLNLSQATLFAFLYELPSWADCQTINGVPYWRIAKAKIIAELPILTDKPDTVYRLMKALEDLGLIEKVQQGAVTLVRITDEGQTWNRSAKSEGSEKNPGRVGNKSAPTPEKNPTYQYTNDQPTRSEDHKPTSPPVAAMDAASDLDVGFDTFWEAGMVKTGKKAARKAFVAAMKRHKMGAVEFGDRLAEDVGRRIAACQMGFDRMHPTTYLNGDRWEDEIVPADRRHQRGGYFSGGDNKPDYWKGVGEDGTF